MKFAYVPDKLDPHSATLRPSQSSSQSLSPHAAIPSPISEDAPADKNPRLVSLLAIPSKKALHIPTSGAKGKAAKMESLPEASLGKAERRDWTANERVEKTPKTRKQKAEEEEKAQRFKAVQKASRQAAMKAERHRRELEKIEEKQRKTGNKKAKAEEKARRVYLGGVVWGFDPNAGRRECGSSAEVENGGCHDRAPGTWSGEQSREGSSAMARPTRRGENDGSAWGIEHGAPSSAYGEHASRASTVRRRPPTMSK